MRFLRKLPRIVLEIIGDASASRDISSNCGLRALKRVGVYKQRMPQNLPTEYDVLFFGGKTISTQKGKNGEDTGYAP